MPARALDRVAPATTHVWRRRLVRLVGTIALALAAALVPVLSVGLDAQTPAEVEARLSMSEADEFPTVIAQEPRDGHGPGVALGRQRPAVTAPPYPFLEVPENPPQRG